MLLIKKILFFRWHKISSEGFRQVFTKIDKHHLCQLNNVILNNVSGLDLVRRSRSHVKGHRRGGVCVLRMLLVDIFFVDLRLKVKSQISRSNKTLGKPVFIHFASASVWYQIEPIKDFYCKWPKVNTTLRSSYFKVS